MISLESRSGYKCHGAGKFIDYLCAINDDNKFFKYFKNIYPKELKHKVEHQGTQATFLELEP